MEVAFSIVGFLGLGIFVLLCAWIVLAILFDEFNDSDNWWF